MHERLRRLTEDGKGCKQNKVYSNTSHLFPSSALVFRPFPGTPLHRYQNLSSSFFNSLGFHPYSKAPGVSSSVKTATFVKVVGMAAMFACLLEAFLASF